VCRPAGAPSGTAVLPAGCDLQSRLFADQLAAGLVLLAVHSNTARKCSHISLAAERNGNAVHRAWVAVGGGENLGLAVRGPHRTSSYRSYSAAPGSSDHWSSE